MHHLSLCVQHAPHSGVRPCTGEGFEVLGCFDQPAQDGVRIDRKDASHGTDAEAFGQRRDGPHQLVGVDLLGVKRRAVCFQEIPAAAQTQELSPAASIGVAGGADVPEADPAVIRTGSMRAKVAGGIDLAATASGHEHMGWRCAGELRLRPDLLLTRLTIGLAREAGKRFEFTLAFRRFRPCWSALAALPKPTKQECQKNEENTGERRESQVESHDQPFHSGGK